MVYIDRVLPSLPWLGASKYCIVLFLPLPSGSRITYQLGSIVNSISYMFPLKITQIHTSPRLRPTQQGIFSQNLSKFTFFFVGLYVRLTPLDSCLWFSMADFLETSNCDLLQSATEFATNFCFNHLLDSFQKTVLFQCLFLLSYFKVSD